MASHYANMLWNYKRQQEALLELEAAIAEFDEANDRKWPHQGNGILNNYLGKLQQRGRYADIEKILLEHLTRPRNKNQITYFENRLDRLDYDALDPNVDREQARRQKVAMLQSRLTRADLRSIYDKTPAFLQWTAPVWKPRSPDRKKLPFLMAKTPFGADELTRQLRSLEPNTLGQPDAAVAIAALIDAQISEAGGEVIEPILE